MQLDNQIEQDELISTEIKALNTTGTKVTKDMSIIDIVQNHTETLEVFAKYGMGCIGCAAARFENLEAGAKVHGFDVDAMVAEINELIGE